jgi:2,3-bisphosphoglycerate-independent phosphoglycerate mutase
MKYAIVLPDGAADEPVASLDGRTPLEAAHTPHIDWISANGRQGLVYTVPPGFSPGSDVATLSLLGYDPKADYSGRAPLEAAARDIPVASDQLVFRCNFVTIVEDVLEDFTAGHVSQREADLLIASLNEKLGGRSLRFHTGVSYRNLMVAHDATDGKLRCTPPHDIPGRHVGEYGPVGTGADWVIGVMRQARGILARHDVNLVRRDLGENPATDIWLWGQGRARPLVSFESRYRVRAAAIAAVDLIRGLAKTIGMTVLDVNGATGFLDTNYAGKGAAAAAALDRFDLVLVHIEAPDEAGHLGDARAKVEALEKIDGLIVGPLLEKLRTFAEWRILISPDHPTPVGKRVHTDAPPPFCMAGHRVHAVLKRPFSERNASESDLTIDLGHELMEYFLRA